MTGTRYRCTPDQSSSSRRDGKLFQVDTILAKIFECVHSNIRRSKIEKSQRGRVFLDKVVDEAVETDICSGTWVVLVVVANNLKTLDGA